MKEKITRIKLTKRLIDAIDPPEQGQIFLRDSLIRGFALRITPGLKAFVLEKRVKGRSRRGVIGQYGSMTLDKARERAEGMVGEIAAGRDPFQEQFDRKKEPTFGDLLQMYRERHLPRKKSAHNDELMIDRYLNEWKSRQLSSFSRRDIATLHMKVGENGGYAANRLAALLKKMFNLAIKSWGIFDGENPVVGIEFFPETKRDRFVQPAELPAFMAALKEEPNLFIRGAIFCLLLTGQRKSEVLKMRWEDIQIDDQQGVWRIPETKAGRPHLVPLPGPVRDLLRNLPVTPDNQFVFPGVRPNSRLTNIDDAWQRLRTRAGLGDLRLHDLRRSTGSWLAVSGASLPLIGKVLNHSTPAATSIYARFNLEPVRVALEANAQRMLLAAAKTPDNGNGKDDAGIGYGDGI